MEEGTKNEKRRKNRRKNKENSLAEKDAKTEVEQMGILEAADQQAEALVKGLIQDIVPKKYEIQIKK